MGRTLTTQSGSSWYPMAKLHSLPSARGIKIADGKMRAWTYSWTTFTHVSVFINNTYRKIACAFVICLYWMFALRASTANLIFCAHQKGVAAKNARGRSSARGAENEVWPNGVLKYHLDENLDLNKNCQLIHHSLDIKLVQKMHFLMLLFVT